MPVNPEFLAHVVDQLRSLGGLATKRMFGGAGLFRDGAMFGLVTNDVLYFKTAEEDRPAFEALGSRPFSFQRVGRTMVTSYWEVPPDIFEEPDRLLDWARRATARARAKAAAPARRTAASGAASAKGTAKPGTAKRSTRLRRRRG